MFDPLTWIIFIAGYAPLHFLGPVLLVLFTGTETAEQRRRLFKGVAIDGAVSMGVAFAVAFWLVTVQRLQTAMGVLLLALFAPYVYLWRQRRRSGVRWFPDDVSE